ncbi:Uncharacterised protein [Mycobacterium tuberculosis]|nr:Uncharacterised protein [Mycobacterium tuberculosis]
MCETYARGRLIRPLHPIPELLGRAARMTEFRKRGGDSLVKRHYGLVQNPHPVFVHVGRLVQH